MDDVLGTNENKQTVSLIDRRRFAVFSRLLSILLGFEHRVRTKIVLLTPSPLDARIGFANKLVNIKSHVIHTEHSDSLLVA